MDSLLQKAEKQLNMIEEALGANDIQSISTTLATFPSTIRSLENRLSRETNMEKRQQFKHSLKQIKTRHLNVKNQYDQKRKELSASQKEKLIPTQGTSLLTQDLLRERESAVLGRGQSQVDEYISIGTSTLDRLRGQREALKGSHRKLTDSITRLGLSQSVMKVISRKTAQDRYIFYGGVIVTFIVLYLCWRYII